MHYPRKNFLAALALGRGVRYTLLAYLGTIYGHQILRWLGRYYDPLLYALIAVAVVGGWRDSISGGATGTRARISGEPRLIELCAMLRDKMPHQD